MGSKKSGFVALATAAVLTLSGCATHPVAPSGEQLLQLRTHGLRVEPVEKASAIRVKTKGQAVAGALFGAIAGSALAGSPQTMTPQALQEAQEMSAQTSALAQRVVSDHGRKVAQARTPALAMSEELTAKLAGLGLPSGPQSYRVVIEQGDWTLDYDSMFGSDNYRLHYELDTSVLDEQGEEVGYSKCVGQSEDTQALDAWKAEDYAKVGDYAKQVGALCGAKLLSDIGLQG